MFITRFFLEKLNNKINLNKIKSIKRNIKYKVLNKLNRRKILKKLLKYLR